MLIVVLCIGAVSCATTPSVPPPESVDEMGDEDILYEAIRSIFDERDLGVSLDSKKFGVVASDYHKVSGDDALRRRYMARILDVPGGAFALRVTAQYERRATKEGEPYWREVDSSTLRERSSDEELALGRAIERRYQEWREASKK